MIVVRFLRSYPPYNAGETAGFSDSDAARLIVQGVAEAAVDVDAPPVESPSAAKVVDAAAPDVSVGKKKA